MLELYSIHRRNVGASLIEINEAMSELLDKQVDKENENLKIKIPISDSFLVTPRAMWIQSVTAVIN